MGRKIKIGPLISPCRLQLADKFLCKALALINVYRCAKFQLPSSNSYGDMEGSQNKKWGADRYIDR